MLSLSVDCDAHKPGSVVLLLLLLLLLRLSVCLSVCLRLQAPVADAYTMNLQSAFWVWNLIGETTLLSPPSPPNYILPPCFPI